MIAPAWDLLVSHLQMACLIAALIWAIGGALLQRRQPSGG
jgi:hypothetical protein